MEKVFGTTFYGNVSTINNKTVDKVCNNNQTNRTVTNQTRRLLTMMSEPGSSTVEILASANESIPQSQANKLSLGIPDIPSPQGNSKLVIAAAETKAQTRSDDNDVTVPSSPDNENQVVVMVSVIVPVVVIIIACGVIWYIYCRARSTTLVVKSNDQKAIFSITPPTQEYAIFSMPRMHIPDKEP
jgi:hypothetical protein